MSPPIPIPMSTTNNKDLFYFPKPRQRADLPEETMVFNTSCISECRPKRIVIGFKVE